jgi:glucosyl-dolichyl phosphate glucuronosyltransferase
MPKISVIVCTYSRADSIKDLLNCLLIQEFNEDYEVIVVDNNSQDNTKQVVGSFEAKFNGRLCYFFEPRQGKPYALNLGIKEARGEILVFTDDDCLVQNDYLSNIYETFQKYGNEVGIVGGKIRPHWSGDSNPPQWFADIQPGSKLESYFKGPLGILDYGKDPYIIDYSHDVPANGHFYGANISIRKEALVRHGYFDPKMTLGQDTEICLRLFRAGVKGVYSPQVVVHHKIIAQRITPRFYYRWFYLRGKYKESNIEFGKKFFYPWGIPTWFIRETMITYLKSFFKKDIHDRIYARCLVFCNLGEMKRLIQDHYA